MSVVDVTTVAVVKPAIPLTAPPEVAPPFDSDSRAWLQSLRADGSTREDAVARLHALLLKAALFECARRR